MHFIGLTWPQTFAARFNLAYIVSEWKNGFLTNSKRELFPPICFVKLVVINTIGPISQIKARNQFVPINTDLDSKLTREIPTTKFISTKVANILFKNWVIPYGTLDILLSDNEQQLLSTFHIYISMLGTVESYDSRISNLNKRIS